MSKGDANFVVRNRQMLWSHRRSQGGLRGHVHPKFLEHIVILCCEKRYPKQNSVIPLKSNILASPKFFGPTQIFGLTTLLLGAPLK